MKTNLSDLYRSNPVRACRLALRRTVNAPERDRLERINSLLGLHGTEAIRGDWQNGYWCDVVATYCNTGAYAVTVMQVRPEWPGGRSRFIVSSWADWVERNGKRYGVG